MSYEGRQLAGVRDVQASETLAALFPRGVVAMELRQLGDPAVLLDMERTSVACAVPARLQEYAAGRLCARAALASLGFVDFPLRSGADRRPLWPQAIVGSITHTWGLCGVAVAFCNNYRGLGLDAEIIGAVDQKLWKAVCTAAEMRTLDDLPAVRRGHAAALIFSAKEAVYKCVYPFRKARIGFQDFSIEADNWLACSGSFVVHPPDGNDDVGLMSDAIGTFRFDDQRVLTGVALLACEGAVPARHGSID